MFWSRAPVICCGDPKPSLSVRNGRFDDPQIRIVVWQSDEFLVPDVSEVVGNWDISIIPHRIHGWYICIHWPTKTTKCRQIYHTSHTWIPRGCVYIYILRSDGLSFVSGVFSARQTKTEPTNEFIQGIPLEMAFIYCTNLMIWLQWHDFSVMSADKWTAPNKMHTSCWRDPTNQLRLVAYPIIYNVFCTLSGGYIAGFQPSTVDLEDHWDTHGRPEVRQNGANINFLGAVGDHFCGMGII